MNFKPVWSTGIACILLTACGSSTRPLQHPEPLVIASCPELTPLSDNTFGATTAKVVEIAGIYYQCRAAAGVK